MTEEKSPRKSIKEHIFKAYDVRGIYPEDINEETAFQISHSLSKLFEPGKIIVGFDVRNGSPSLAEKVKEGLEKGFEKAGKDLEIEFIGLSTTPMFYFLVNHFKAQGGVMVTASHNPKEYNGLKIVGEKAMPISGLEVKKLVFRDML